MASRTDRSSPSVDIEETYAIVTRPMRILLATLVAILLTASFADAAAEKTGVRHRPRHSSRVSATNDEPAPAKKKKSTARKKKSAAKNQPRRTHKKPPPSTKPR